MANNESTKGICFAFDLDQLGLEEFATGYIVSVAFILVQFDLVWYSFYNAVSQKLRNKVHLSNQDLLSKSLPSHCYSFS